jgi:hypothetical protein
MSILHLQPHSNRISASAVGGMPKVYSFTPGEINRKVDQLLTTDRSNLRNLVIELLYQFVVLTETSLFAAVRAEIEISDSIDSFSRCLRRYRSEGLIASVSQNVIKESLRAGMPKVDSRQLRAYRIGPVGEKYIERKGWNGDVPIISVSDEYLTHDLLCAEAMLRMSQLWLAHPTSPGLVEVRGPREVLAWNAEKNIAVVAPDGLLIKRSKEGIFERAFLVEYQNVRALLQVQNKLKKYEEIAKPEYRWIWEDVWGVEDMPYVLVLHRQGATLKHYREEIATREDMLARFASISLEDVWAGNLSIKPIR